MYFYFHYFFFGTETINSILFFYFYLTVPSIMLLLNIMIVCELVKRVVFLDNYDGKMSFCEAEKLLNTKIEREMKEKFSLLIIVEAILR